MNHSTAPGCPLCPGNGMVEIVADHDLGYLVAAKNSPLEGCYLMVPHQHITNFLQLPEEWQAARRYLLLFVPWFHFGAPLNISLNLGEQAGQTLEHLHEWVIPRAFEEPDSPTYRKGLATLIREFELQLAT